MNGVITGLGIGLSHVRCQNIIRIYDEVFYIRITGT